MIKKGMSLEQGESKVNFVNHGPDDVRGPASLSSLRDSCFLAQLATLLQGMKRVREVPTKPARPPPLPHQASLTVTVTLACHSQLPFETHQALPDPILQ